MHTCTFIVISQSLSVSYTATTLFIFLNFTKAEDRTTVRQQQKVGTFHIDEEDRSQILDLTHSVGLDVRAYTEMLVQS